MGPLAVTVAHQLERGLKVARAAELVLLVDLIETLRVFQIVVAKLAASSAVVGEHSHRAVRGKANHLAMQRGGAPASIVAETVVGFAQVTALLVDLLLACGKTARRLSEDQKGGGAEVKLAKVTAGRLSLSAGAPADRHGDEQGCDRKRLESWSESRAPYPTCINLPSEVRMKICTTMKSWGCFRFNMVVSVSFLSCGSSFTCCLCLNDPNVDSRRSYILLRRPRPIATLPVKVLPMA